MNEVPKNSIVYGDLDGLPFNLPIIDFDARSPKTTEVVRFSRFVPHTFTNKTGHSFGGWFIDSACTIPWLNIAVTRDITLYAKWIPVN